MQELLLGLALGALAAGLVAWLLRRRKPGASAALDVHSSVLRFREVGELVVFRMVSQQIVTVEDHPAGRFRELVSWLLSTKKMALVVEYGIDFKYDLRNPALRIEPGEGRAVRVALPPLEFQPHVRDIRFYDERNARWLPFLLGDITELIGPRFGQADKNKLIAEAREQAEGLARRSAADLQGEVQASARRTLEALARGFGVEALEIEFPDAAPVPLKGADSAPAQRQVR